jgi:hypothetical protein
VRRLLPTPLAKLLELDFLRHELLVLAGPIVDVLARRALEFDELILRHGGTIP